MATKSDFTEEEWTQILEGPTSAGLIVITSDRGGSIRETFSMAKAYTEAHRKPGQSELLDEIVGARPEVDRSRPPSSSPEALREHSLQNIREAIALLKEKAPEDVEAYREFVLALVDRVAEARKEGFMGLTGDRVSEDEHSAIDEITAALS
jgi:hypothetical protein